MKWMEMIRVRSSAQGVQAMREYLSVHMPTYRGVAHVENAFVLKHALYDEDLAIMFVWNSDREPDKTREGHFLARYCAQYGAVDHSIWCMALDALGNLHDKKDGCGWEKTE